MTPNKPIGWEDEFVAQFNKYDMDNDREVLLDGISSGEIRDFIKDNFISKDEVREVIDEMPIYTGGSSVNEKDHRIVKSDLLQKLNLK